MNATTQPSTAHKEGHRVRVQFVRGSGVVPLSVHDFEMREETDERVPAGLLPSKLGDRYLSRHSYWKNRKP